MRIERAAFLDYVITINAMVHYFTKLQLALTPVGWSRELLAGKPRHIPNGLEGPDDYSSPSSIVATSAMEASENRWQNKIQTTEAAILTVPTFFWSISTKTEIIFRKYGLQYGLK